MPVVYSQLALEALVGRSRLIPFQLLRRLDINLTPPSPTTVRTGATATLEVNGALPMAILAWARDRAGNYIELPQFDLRSPETGAQCRGN
jgi:hypothetical protein